MNCRFVFIQCPAQLSPGPCVRLSGSTIIQILKDTMMFPPYIFLISLFKKAHVELSNKKKKPL